MLKQLRIKNFKGWKDTGSIRMAPMTLFFGTNSSGKSSIGQFLIMLKQTVDSPDRKAVFFPGGKNTAVHLGSFQEMVYQRKLENHISFDYSWNVSKPVEIIDSISQKSFTGNQIGFSAEVGFGNNGQSNLSLNKFTYVIQNKDKQILSIGMELAESKSEYKIDAAKYELKRKQGKAWPIEEPVRFYGFPNEVLSYFQNADFVQELNLANEKLFQSICYLGPLRTKAERLYTWAGNRPDSVGYDGENAIAALLAARNRQISSGKRKKGQTFEEVIADRLKHMGLIEDFRVIPISELRQEYEVKIRTKGTLENVDLPDVGFGVSQVLPVLIECFYAPQGSIIIMEQPEIHLHPSAQAALADVMIDVLKSRQDGRNREIQLIIETHSEHFLRRLQRRIAEGAIGNEDVAAYFADVSRSSASLKPLEVDEYGNIRNWPDNFFGDEMGDITEKTKAALKKRMASEKKTSKETPDA